jgi:hypothetical protein
MASSRPLSLKRCFFRNSTQHPPLQRQALLVLLLLLLLVKLLVKLVVQLVVQLGQRVRTRTMM